MSGSNRSRPFESVYKCPSNNKQKSKWKKLSREKQNNLNVLAFQDGSNRSPSSGYLYGRKGRGEREEEEGREKGTAKREGRKGKWVTVDVRC
jgi:hypothetical protein